MTRALCISFICAIFSAHLYGQVIARLVKADGGVYFKRLGMNTFSEEAMSEYETNLCQRSNIFVRYQKCQNCNGYKSINVIEYI